MKINHLPSARAIVILMGLSALSPVRAEEPGESAIKSRIADGVLRVAQGEPAFEENKPGLDVVTPDSSSPVAYGQSIRNFYRNSDPDRWTILNTMPAWLPAMKGDTTAKGKQTPVDLDLGDTYHLMSRYLSYGMLINVEARRRRVSLFTDIMYLRMSGHVSGETVLPPLTERGPGIDLSGTGNFDMSTGIYELGAGYRFLDHPWGGENSQKRISMDVIAGARYWRLWTKVGVDATASVGPISRSAGVNAEGTKDWVDPFVGLRLQADATEKMFFYLRGDVGGFGIGNGFSSDFSWKAQAGVSYNPLPRLSLFAGYQVLDVDYTDGGFGYNIRQMGPVLGLTYAIGGTPAAAEKQDEPAK